jgi:hypothetical protein
MARAFFGEQQSSTISELLAELDAEELAEEPLEVAVPWDKDAAKAAPAEGKQDG